ncbi:MAG TPA: HD-GYP domain-containing protein [Nitrospirota bacterium]|nr:HD-GYP domain-containing protein [Nitrospirota bacterium]
MAESQNDSQAEAQQSFFAKQQLIGSAKTAFQQLSAVMKNATLYPAAHPFLLATAEKLLGTIEALLVDRKEVAFYLAAGELFFETLSVPVDQSLSLLMEHFVARDVGGILFKPALTAPELIRLASVMSKDLSFFTARGGAAEVVAKEDISHIELRRVLLVDKKIGSSFSEEKKKASVMFMDAVTTVKDMVHAVHRDESANMVKMNTIVQTMVDNLLENRDALLGLTSLKMYDEYTFTHSVNTAILAVSLGTFLSFSKPQLAALGVAGLMHDIGKVSVPIEIINKPGKLTDDEWEEVKRHPIEGALILADIPGVSKMAMVAAFEHHQHGDVRGYPRMDDSHQQHLFSQIVAISDAYEALTAARVYYSVQMPAEKAIQILLSKRGSTFNPILVKAFVNMIGIFPIGTILKLDTGEIGLVVHQTRDLMRPRVLLLSKFDGSEKESGTEASLLETVGGSYKRTAIGTVNPYTAKIDIKKYLA